MSFEHVHSLQKTELVRINAYGYSISLLETDQLSIYLFFLPICIVHWMYAVIHMSEPDVDVLR